MAHVPGQASIVTCPLSGGAAARFTTAQSLFMKSRVGTMEREVDDGEKVFLPSFTAPAPEDAVAPLGEREGGGDVPA